MRIIPFISLFILCSTVKGQWKKIETGTEASFRSMEVLSRNVIWAGGTQNTVLKTKNGGEIWQSFRVSPNLELDFRGIKAFDRRTAIIVSAGLAEKGAAKIYKTMDGGNNWKLVYTTDEKGVFLDGIAFFDKMHGLVIGDPIMGKAYVLETKDGGDNWQRMPPELFPKLEEGEASFAASNSCLVTFENTAWYAFQSRILYTSDRGKSWEILSSEFPSGASSGIFGLHFWSTMDGIALGGDYKDDKSKQINLSITSDGGITWSPMKIENQGLKESGAKTGNELIVVGTSGSSISKDLGKNWEPLDSESFHVVKCAGKNCFAIGAKGNFGRLKL